MMSIFKNLLLSLFVLISVSAHAERFSYVYIQGDKQTPFYVKLEDDMLPRYGKNYCIIPQLAPGPIRIQILFQQNAYPAQAFNIQVPPDGYRGFLLVKNNDGFALFDIQQHFYLLPGAEGEDHLPEVNATQAVIPIAENEPVTPPPVKSGMEPIARNPKKTIRKATPSDPPPPPPAIGNNDEPQFISGIELNNERKPVQNIPEKDLEEEIIIKEEPQQQAIEETAETDIVVTAEPAQEPYEQPEIPSEPATAAVEEIGMHDTEQEMNEPVPPLTENAPAIINSDCPEPLSDSKFDDIFIASRAKSNDDKRIGYLMKKAENNCFTTRQAFLLSRQLQAESMRYSFLKKVYPRVTDQQNFHLLGDALFKTMEWKSYFKLIYE